MVWYLLCMLMLELGLAGGVGLLVGREVGGELSVVVLFVVVM